MTPVVFEMETADPDDFLTLLWLVDHPELNLVGVLLEPGTIDQARLVRWALKEHISGYPETRFVDIGRRDDYDNPKDRQVFADDPFATPHVSAWHYKVYGEDLRHYSYGHITKGVELLMQLVDAHPDLTVVTGAAPKILGTAFRRHPELRLKRWVMQGCFAGDNLVAPERRLAKFAGRTTCASYNPGGAPKEMLELLATDRIELRQLVSKNVCHGVRWTPRMQRALLERLADSSEELEATARRGVKSMIRGFNAYLSKGGGTDHIPWEMESEKQGQGKAMHDLVAGAVVADPTVCTFRQVEVYRERGEWGARAADNTNTFISVAFNEERFLDVLAR